MTNSDSSAYATNLVVVDDTDSVIYKTGGSDFYNRYLYDHHGFTTIYNDLDTIRDMIIDVLTANEYKYEHLYNTIAMEYDLSDPIDRTTTETHSGTDITTDDGSNNLSRAGTDTTTNRTTSDTTDTHSIRPYDSSTLTTASQDTESYANTSALAYNSTQNRDIDNERTVEHGHVITTRYQYYREPQSEIQSERQIAMFSLQMTIIGDILDAIAIPVYIDYDKTYSMPY